MIHELKIFGEYFEAVIDGRKPFEVRLNDRNYMPGDVVILKEVRSVISTSTSALSYTGRYTVAEISYVYENSNFLAEGYCVFGIKPKCIKETEQGKFEIYGKASKG